MEVQDNRANTEWEVVQLIIFEYVSENSISIRGV